MVFKKILVALDNSSQSSLVFEQALELAQTEESHLMLFHCLSLETDGAWTPFVGTLGDMDMYNTFQRLQRERLHNKVESVHRWLQTYCQQATAHNVPCELDCKLGDVGSQICEAARQWEADVIVLSRRGRKGLSELLLGSVSNYVLHYAPCSVLVVQGITLPLVDTSAIATQANLNS
jgi:nucleotide-binding universal stress UspA family protein